MSEIFLPPSAAGLSNSLRGIGYSLEMAISDIIDNSISAGATIISIETPLYEEGIDYLVISDNGSGMTRSELIDAMKLGSCSPTKIRNLNDLGRFGMGLKSASFSQCRKLTVASKVNSKISAFSWDIDELEKSNDWRLMEIDPQKDPKKFSSLEKVISGTVVVWEKLDRALAASDTAQKEDLEVLRSLRKHISLTFHRFLEDSDFKLILNGVVIKPWDPFFKFHPAKQFDFPEAYWPESSRQPEVKLQAYVLPLPEKSIESNQFFSPEDDLKLQGFFIYRGKRLISYGGWLGLKNLDTAPEYKLVRIRLDFQNTNDSEWSLDIRKTIAKPPRKMRAWLTKHATLARNKSKVALINTHNLGQKFTPNSFWRRNYGMAPTLNWSDTFVTLFFQFVEEGRLTSDLLKGYLEIISLSHPTNTKKIIYQVPSKECIATMRFIYQTLSTQLSSEEAQALMKNQIPFSCWKVTLNEIFQELKNVRE